MFYLKVDKTLVFDDGKVEEDKHFGVDFVDGDTLGKLENLTVGDYFSVVGFKLFFFFTDKLFD